MHKNKQLYISILCTYIVFLLFCSYFFIFTEKGFQVFVLISPCILIFLPTLLCCDINIKDAKRMSDIKAILWTEPIIIAVIPCVMLLGVRFLYGLDFPYIEIITFFGLCIICYILLIITLIVNACFLYIIKKSLLD